MTVLFVTIAEPGHGKSFVANQISDLCGARHIRSDYIRKNRVADGDPVYSSDESQKTYDILFEEAEESLMNGSHVVLDATFNKKVGRERAHNISERTGAKVVFIRVECDSETAKKRIREREGISDADIEVYENFRIEPIENRDTVTVDNSGSRNKTVTQVENIVRESVN